MANYANSEEGYKCFLEEFTKRNPPTEDTLQTFHPQTTVVTNEEFEGEVLSNCLTALELELDQCPDHLKFLIARAATNEVLSGGKERFRESQVPTEIPSEDGDSNVSKEQQNVSQGSEETLYSTAPIAKAAFQAVQDICVKWQKELPKFDIPSQQIYSVHGIKNTRRKMEDRHTVITELNTLLHLEDERPTQFYAVYDGHGGLDASVYASKHLHIALSRHKSFSTDLDLALKESILHLDNAYCKKSERDGLRSGTTAVAAAIRDEVLYLSWIGDSQAVLVRDGREFQLMVPHKPDRPDEKKRIENLGGCVIWFGAWRVNGTLSVSRAIGDPEFKPFVCGEADSMKTDLTDDDDYLCIACDGFWDVFNGTQLAQMVSEHLHETGDKSSLSKVLCNKAKDAGSSDNITVLIVFLKDVISAFKGEETGAQEKVENAGTENSEQDSDESNENQSSNENTNTEEKNEDKSESLQGDSVVVQGSKLQPGVKEKPPHRLLVNKPQNINSKVNVLVTDTAPHARLPTHKPLRQKSPVMEKRGTRGSLLSLGTIEPDEVTMPLEFKVDNRLNVHGLHAQVGFPTISHPQKVVRLAQVRSTPSPSVMSEPVMSGESFSAVAFPSKPVAEKNSTGRRTYRTSIVMNRHFGDAGSFGTYGYQNPKLLRRVSRSVPDHLNKLSKKSQQGQLLESRNRLGQSQPTSHPMRRHYGGDQKENMVPSRMPNFAVFPDTDIAITNSLHNKIKPKRSRQKRLSSASLRYSSQAPIVVRYWWQKN